MIDKKLHTWFREIAKDIYDEIQEIKDEEEIIDVIHDYLFIVYASAKETKDAR